MFKQRKIGTFMGMVKIILGNISPYASYLSLALIVPMSFYTTISPLFTEWFGIPFPFWIFCSLLVLIIGIVGALEYIYMMPSYFEASNIQSWEAGSPFRDKLESVEKDVLEVKNLLNDLLEKYES